MGALIDNAPRGRMPIFVGAHGDQWDEKELCKQVTVYRRKASPSDDLRSAMPVGPPAPAS